MAKVLDVYFHEKIIGQLVQDEHGEMNFSYAKAWVDNPQASAISCSLPLRLEKFKQKECRAFFEGILPEQPQRQIIGRNLGISSNNDFSMLEKIGGECAGALTFVPSLAKPAIEENDYRELNQEELTTILKELPTKPLLAGERGIRLSLAGVQEKLAVFVQDGKIFLPLNNAPSNHILKPDHGMFEHVVFNEHFCLTLAKEIGLSVADTKIQKVADIHYLAVSRYDRLMVNGKIKRLHQEDFCQAMGMRSINKYQSEGGPTLKQCFDLLRKYASIPVLELDKLLDAVIYNFLIGNCDAHGKNFSLLYADTIQLAPLYDLICTVYYHELSQKMAMKLGGEYQLNKITLANFDKLAGEAGLSKAGVRKKIIVLAKRILAAIPTITIQHAMQLEVAKIIKQRCEAVR